jgi:hypothetical protein
VLLCSKLFLISGVLFARDGRRLRRHELTRIQ